jgi:hypothetical protein
MEEKVAINSPLLDLVHNTDIHSRNKLVTPKNLRARTLYCYNVLI